MERDERQRENQPKTHPGPSRAHVSEPSKVTDITVYVLSGGHPELSATPQLGDDRNSRWRIDELQGIRFDPLSAGASADHREPAPAEGTPAVRAHGGLPPGRAREGQRRGPPAGR